LEEVSNAEHQPMAVIVDPSPPADPSTPAATKGGTNSSESTIVIAADAESEEVHLQLLPILPMHDDCVVLNGTYALDEEGWHLQGVWANSSREYNDRLTEPYVYSSTAQSDGNNSISIMDAEFHGHFQFYYDENVEDKFTLRPLASTDSCTYFEGRGHNKFMSYSIIGVLLGDQITMVRLLTDDADAMDDDGEPDDGENGAPNGESEKVIDERPPPTILNRGHVISLRGQCEILEGGSTKIDGMWAEHFRMLTNDDICHRFSYASETAKAPPHEGQYNGIFFNAGMGISQQHNDTFSLTFTENSHGTHNVEGRGYNELAGDYIISGIMIGSDITMQRHLIDVNEEGTKRVQSEAKLPSTAEVKEPGKGSKRRKKEKGGSTKTDKSVRKFVTNMTNKVKNKVVEVAAKYSGKPRWSVVVVGDDCVLVDPKNKREHEPWYNHIKVYCPDAHPEKQATTMQKTVWVCMFCREEKKDLSTRNVKKHVEKRHPEKYEELCTLDSSPLFQETLQQQRDEEFNQLVLVDPKNKREHEPWYNHIKVYCPDAHPEKQATTMQKTVWVCMLCKGERKDLNTRNVKGHFASRHPEKYEECLVERVLVKEFSSCKRRRAESRRRRDQTIH